jgi:hypothetical protein
MSAPFGEFKQLFVVCTGSFNPKIFHPEWFVRYNLITEEEAASSVIHLLTEQIAHVEIQNVILQCVNDRLSLGTLDARRFDMMHDLFVGMFTLLPHTPITAIGINPAAHFPTNSESAWHQIGNSLAPKEDVWNELYEQPGMLNLTILAQRSGKHAGPTRIMVEPSARFKNGLFVGINYHYDVPSRDAVAGVLSFVSSDWQLANVETERVATKIFQKLVL